MQRYEKPTNNPQETYKKTYKKPTRFLDWKHDIWGSGNSPSGSRLARLVLGCQVLRDHKGFLPPSLDTDRLEGLSPEEQAELVAAVGSRQSAFRRFLGTEEGPVGAKVAKRYRVAADVHGSLVIQTQCTNVCPCILFCTHLSPTCSMQINAQSHVEVIMYMRQMYHGSFALRFKSQCIYIYICMCIYIYT